MHAHTHTHTKLGTPASTPTRTGNNAQTLAHSHKCTLARRTSGALTYETVGAATPWRQEHRISATRASKRRPSTRCKRKAKLRLDLVALRLVRVASREWGFRWAAVGDANSSTNGDTHTRGIIRITSAGAFGPYSLLTCEDSCTPTPARTGNTATDRQTESVVHVQRHHHP
jgi:hypothetical protein